MRRAEPPHDRCLACGRRLGALLAFAGSLRCDDCRASSAPLSAELVHGPPATEDGEVAA